MTNPQIHPSAFVDKGALLGQNTKVWHHSHLTETAVVGQHCSIGQNCYIAGTLGNNCKLQNNVNVYQGVKLQDWVFCGPSMTFTNVLIPRAKYPVNGVYQKTLVKEGASLGAHSTIVCGVTIGKWAMIGAGSIVTRDVPDYALVYGNPAKIQGWVCECGQKLVDDFTATTCSKCAKKYQKHDQTISPRP